MKQWKLWHMHKYNIWVFPQYITICISSMNKEKLILALWIWTETVVFLWFFDFRTTGASIWSTDLVSFDLVSHWIYDLIFNCPLTLHLYPWLLLSLLLLEWNHSIFLLLAFRLCWQNCKSTISSSTSRIHILLRPSTPGMSGRWEEFRVKKMADEWRKRTIWGWEILIEATHVEQEFCNRFSIRTRLHKLQDHKCSHPCFLFPYLHFLSAEAHSVHQKYFELSKITPLPGVNWAPTVPQ